MAPDLASRASMLFLEGAGEYAKVTPASSVLAGLKAARAALDRAITLLERAREDG